MSTRDPTHVLKRHRGRMHQGWPYLELTHSSSKSPEVSSIELLSDGYHSGSLSRYSPSSTRGLLQYGEKLSVWPPRSAIMLPTFPSPPPAPGREDPHRRGLRKINLHGIRSRDGAPTTKPLEWSHPVAPSPRDVVPAVVHHAMRSTKDLGNPMAKGPFQKTQPALSASSSPEILLLCSNR